MSAVRSVPLGDAPALRRVRKRSRLTRCVLAVALLATLVAAFLSSEAPAQTSTPSLSGSSKGVIVLDLSASVEMSTLEGMYHYLMRFADSHGRYGLVLFSDQAYEALPPETPASALKQFAHFFNEVPQPAAQQSGGAKGAPLSPTFPTNPWAYGFTFGTHISYGLDLARVLVVDDAASERDVWLISDLGDDPPDFPLVASEASEYLQDGVTLHVLGLNPTTHDAEFFASHFGPSSQGTGALPQPLRPRTGHTSFPLGLAIAAGLLALLLAANELLSTPLRFGASPAQPHGAAA